MADSFSAPQDSVLRRHHESALLYAREARGAQQVDEAKVESASVPTDSVLRRHYESAIHDDASGMSKISNEAAASNGQVSSPLTGHAGGPSTLRPAHAAIPYPSEKRSGGLFSSLRRLLGGS
jgi:hypothetical protein